MKQYIHFLFASLLTIASFTAEASPISSLVKVATKSAIKESTETVAKKAAQEGAEAVAKKAAQEGAEAVAKKAAQEGAEAATKKAVSSSLGRVIAKCAIRPGVILAVGGAVAANKVANGAEEGAQEVSKAFADSVREHPEVAIQTSHTVTKPVSNIVTAVMIAGLMIVLYICYPLIKISHATIKKYCDKKLKKVETTDNAEIEDSKNNSQAGKININLIFAIIAFAIIAYLSLMFNNIYQEKKIAMKQEREYAQELVQIKKEHDQELNRAKKEYAKKVDFFTKEYCKRINVHYQTFQQELATTTKSEFDAIKGKSKATADEFASFSCVKNFLVAMVLDKVKGGNRLQNSISEKVKEKYYSSLCDAYDNSKELLIKFNSNLEAERQAYIKNIANIDTEGIVIDDSEFIQNMSIISEKIDNETTELFATQMGAFVGVAFETVFIRSTIHYFSSVLGKTAAKAAASAGIGAGLAVADGPLPIGDIVCAAINTVSIGCCAYDIHKATRVMPKEIQNTLNQTTDSIRKSTLEELQAVGEKLYNAYLTQGENNQLTNI